MYERVYMDDVFEYINENVPPAGKINGYNTWTEEEEVAE